MLANACKHDTIGMNSGENAHSNAAAMVIYGGYDSIGAFCTELRVLYDNSYMLIDTYFIDIML